MTDGRIAALAEHNRHTSAPGAECPPNCPYYEASLVDRAEQALRAFGDLTYTRAAQMLNLWPGNKDLSVAQRAEVLRRFTNVDLVMKCGECGELVEHYAGEPAHVFHHLAWKREDSTDGH